MSIGEHVADSQAAVESYRDRTVVLDVQGDDDRPYGHSNVTSHLSTLLSC